MKPLHPVSSVRAVGRLAGLLLLVLTLAPASSAPAPSPTPESQAAATTRNIDVDTLKEELAQAPILVDVRTIGEFSGGHVHGAVNIPLQELQARMSELAPYRGAKGPVYVICQSGGRSSAAARQLNGAGISAVNVEGGTGTWRARGYPVE